MRAANRIKGGIDASAILAACGEPAHGRDEVAGAVVDRYCTEAAASVPRCPSLCR